MLEEGEDSEQHLVGQTLDTRHLFTPGPHDSENTTHHHKDIKFKRVSMSDVLSRLIFLIGRNAISGGGFGHISNTIQQLFSVSHTQLNLTLVTLCNRYLCYDLCTYLHFVIQLDKYFHINNQVSFIFNIFSQNTFDALYLYCYQRTAGTSM